MADEPEVSEEFGPNAWLVDELYEQYRSDPNSVSASWQEFFADYRRDDVGAGNGAPPQNADEVRLEWWGGALTLMAYAVLLAGFGIWRMTRADIS